jgi:hypothetical protein
MDNMISLKDDTMETERVSLARLAAAVAAAAIVLGGVFAIAPAAAADAIAPAAPATTLPATTPTSRATTASAAADPVSEEAMKILHELEAAGDKYRTIRANLDYEVVNLVLGDSEKRTGWVTYSKGDDDKTPTRFRVAFKKLRLGDGNERDEPVDYAFDGQWLTEAKHNIKNITLYQLAAAGQKVEPLRIGKGPFPLPFGQKAADMVKYFIPSTRPPVQSDPNGTIYLRLLTRPQYDAELPTTRMEMWIDAKTYLPVRLKSRDKNKAVTTVTFKDITTNKAVDEGAFRIPHPIGYDVIRRPYGNEGAAAP